MHDRQYDMHINVSGLLRNFARVRRAALSGETVVIATRDGNLVLMAEPRVGDALSGAPRDVAVALAGEDPDGGLQRGEPESGPRHGGVLARAWPVGARSFVSRGLIADAARSAPRIDAQRFRADVDAVIDPHVDG